MKRTTREAESVVKEDLKGRRIHFMGAGGIGVSALMELARARGAIVSGCDGSSGGQVKHLRSLGIDVKVGHDASHIDGCDELVHTPAVPDDHPEIARAREDGLMVSVRMRMLGRLARGTRTICITGSHGKTSVTWMMAHLLIEAGRDPSVLVGGVVPSLGSNVRVGGHSGELVLEVDESDNRLDAVVPALPIVTNIDNDHLEHYGSMDALQAAITRFMASANQASDPNAALIGCGDDARVREALKAAARETGLEAFPYGFDRKRAVRAKNVRFEGMRSRFTCVGPFGEWKDLSLPHPGRHNVLNSLGAITAAWRLGVDEGTIRAALASCERVGRRFEIKGVVDNVRVVDDYGHHPAEVAATMASARTSTQGRIGVLFQPHRYTRTAELMDEFGASFADGPADYVCILPVYAASEEPIPGADHEALVKRIRSKGHRNAAAVVDRAEGVARMAEWARAGDTILTQGAGDVTFAGPDLLAAIASRVPELPRERAVAS